MWKYLGPSVLNCRLRPTIESYLETYFRNFLTVSCSQNVALRNTCLGIWREIEVEGISFEVI
jgi:hypothetical protein